MSSRRVSKLPEANKMARSIRNGSTTGDLAVRYGINSNVIVRQLLNSGWDPATGIWVGDNRPKGAPLNARGDGQGETRHHVGGGDNPTVVPLAARPIRERVRQPFVWPQAPEQPKVASPAESAQPARPVTELAKRRKPGPKAGTPSTRAYKPRSREGAQRPPWCGVPGGRLTVWEKSQIIQRYIAGEPATSLGAEFGADDRTVRNLLKREGVPLRTRGEAIRLRHERERQRRARGVLPPRQVRGEVS